MSQRHVGSLELDQDLDFQRREWVVQRAGWAVMALMVVSALLGLFATGPLSSASATTDDGSLRVEYGRFARHEAFTALRLEFGAEAVQESAVQIHVSQAFLDAWQIESIIPEPDSSNLVSDGVTWTFSVGDVSEPGEIELRVKPESIGIGRGTIGLAGGERLTIRQLIYP